MLSGLRIASFTLIKSSEYRWTSCKLRNSPIHVNLMSTTQVGNWYLLSIYDLQQCPRTGSCEGEGGGKWEFDYSLSLPFYSGPLGENLKGNVLCMWRRRRWGVGLLLFCSSFTLEPRGRTSKAMFYFSFSLFAASQNAAITKKRYLMATYSISLDDHKHETSLENQ